MQQIKIINLLLISGTTIRDLNVTSYMSWTLKYDFLNEVVKPRMTEIQMRFRTRDTDGILLHLPSNTEEFITLKVCDLLAPFWKTFGMDMSHLVGKPTICLCENKGADQLRGNREADQHLCFRCSDSTISLLLKSEISSF